MKVLLIQSPLGRNHMPVYPIGLSYIASAIQDKHIFEIVDTNLFSFDEIKNKINKFKPDVIGIGLRNIDTSVAFDRFNYFAEFPPFVKKIKQVSNYYKIIVGGSGFSIFPFDIIKALRPFLYI